MDVQWCCYRGDCWAYDSEKHFPDEIWAGPCWGESTVIDEDYPDDPVLRTWVHGCDGHRERWQKYVPPPSGGRNDVDEPKVAPLAHVGDAVEEPVAHAAADVARGLDGPHRGGGSGG